mmetsp:Transcript_11462/g.33286  ORF Transcript_11462/g.33286 Transcript_11462/m.33286 type:complete len:163 (+) Transcript_11462:602-1090(+)
MAGWLAAVMFTAVCVCVGVCGSKLSDCLSEWLKERTNGWVALARLLTVFLEAGPRVDGWMDGSSSPVCTRRLSITAHIHTHTFSVCLSRSVSLSLLACPTHDMLTLPLDVSLHTTPHTGAQDTSQTDRRTEGATRKQNKQPSAFIHNECTHPIPTICDALCD